VILYSFAKLVENGLNRLKLTEIINNRGCLMIQLKCIMEKSDFLIKTIKETLWQYTFFNDLYFHFNKHSVNI